MSKYPKDYLEIYFEHGVDLVNRKIFMTGEVDFSVNACIKAIYMLASESKVKPIELFINSPGGDEYEMLSLYDVLNSIECPIHTIGMGKIMSAAPLLIAVGREGHRYAMPNSTWMVHEGHIYPDTSAARTDELFKNLKHFKKLNDIWVELMVKHTNKDAKHWNRLCKSIGDTYFDAETALEWGIVDYIWNQKEGE